ncbi:DNA-directed DNA polymerase II small subunit [Candidatus Micrarchaeota archaeon]|nr:DNA-directed DNA polymerase II small subunit [Candidatus Micrarchaeota archaeon]
MDAQEITAKVQEKELLIERSAVDCLLNLENAQLILEKALEQVEGFVITHKLIDSIMESQAAEKKAIQVVIKPQIEFSPPAKEIPSALKHREDYDVSEKSRCTGVIEDFVNYFRDRFRRISPYIRSRPGGGGVTQIAALKGFTKGRSARIIGMVREKRNARSGHALIEVEDEEDFITCLIPKDSPLFPLGAEILLDEVIGLDGYVSNGLFIVKNVLWPEVPIRSKKLIAEDVSVGLLSDLHIGSKNFLSEDFERLLRFLNGEGSDYEREIAGKIKYLLIAGDIVDGIGIYPTQEKQLVSKDIYTQYEIFAEFMKNVPEYIEVVISPGNHDAVRNAEPQPRLLKEFTRDLEGFKNMHFVGNPALLEIHELKTLIYHGTSLDTMIANMSLQAGYQNPEKVAIEMLKRRHLSSVYGEKPIVPEKRDYMVIDEVPDLFHFGHVHKNGYSDYRGTMIINSGTWQSVTDYQIRLGHVPTPSQFPIYNLRTGSLNVMNFGKSS